MASWPWPGAPCQLSSHCRAWACMPHVRATVQPHRLRRKVILNLSSCWVTEAWTEGSGLWNPSSGTHPQGPGGGLHPRSHRTHSSSREEIAGVCPSLVTKFVGPHVLGDQVGGTQGGPGLSRSGPCASVTRQRTPAPTAAGPSLGSTVLPFLLGTAETNPGHAQQCPVPGRQTALWAPPAPPPPPGQGRPPGIC